MQRKQTSIGSWLINSADNEAATEAATALAADTLFAMSVAGREESVAIDS